MTLHASAVVALVPLANRMLEGMNMGWTQSIDRIGGAGTGMNLRLQPGA